MATAVLEVELRQLPSSIPGLVGYRRALVLLRLGNRPVGQILVPVWEGTISGTELREAVSSGRSWAYWQRWLEEYLECEEAHVPGLAPPEATVAVCTRDRPEDLRRCLDALQRIRRRGAEEVLVVDNCPTSGATRDLVESYRGIRYVREDRPGLNAARNRALREARHQIVAFTDDDAVPDPGWLAGLLGNFGDGSVMAVTGLTMPLELETEAQEWHERLSSFGRGFARRVFESPQLSPAAGGQVGAGVNMALRREVLRHVGPFDEALDAGTPTRSGGDNEMFSRILSAGYRIVYDPQALSWHRHRRSWSELRDTLYGYGVGVYAAWTGLLLVHRETSVPRQAWGWLIHDQLPRLLHALLRRPGAAPLDLLMAELRGCAAGPPAYLASRRRAHPRRGP